MYWYFLSTKTTEIYCLLKVLNIFGSLYTLFEEKIMQSSCSIFDFSTLVCIQVIAENVHDCAEGVELGNSATGGQLSRE